MIETYKNKKQGIRVDPGRMMLCGIVNMFCQSEQLEQIEEKGKILEQENLKNKMKCTWGTWSQGHKTK